jgi:hypothetical protein
MTDSPLPHSGSPWANRNLRHRSFRGQNLTGADFSGSDLRGCDFSKAQLQHANFRQVKAGLTRRQLGVQIAIALGVALWMGHIVSQLVISSLGQTMDDRAWQFVVLLYVVLGLAGLSNALQNRAVLPRRSLAILAGALPVALVGFFYAGTASDNNPTVAAIGAVVGAAIGIAGSGRRFYVITTAAGAVCAYGFTFWLGSTAIALMTVQRFVWGIPIAILTCCWLWLTWRCCCLILDRIQQTIGTSFRGADLTHAKFDQMPLPNTDFSHAVGYSDEAS